MHKPILIPIEALEPGETIYRTGGDFGPIGWFAEVQDVEEDAEEGVYHVTVLIDGWSYSTEFTVAAGEHVQFGGVGEPEFSRVPGVKMEAA